MITSINKDNSAAYLSLYESVEDYLKTHDLEGRDKDDEKFDGPLMAENDSEGNELHITSLDELFGYMKTLRKVKPELTRLPLDEFLFEIDANTRKIIVPPEINKNGIVLAVEGDEIAESIYFIIDRFYDHVDLGTQQIFIQYVNANGVEKASVPPVVDLTSKPGKIIIEWPISSIVTKSAGSVTFSIRFFTYDVTDVDAEGRGGKVTYSLSTLPATLSVKASQNFDIVHVEEEDTSMREENKVVMENRLIDSPLYGHGSSVATKPIFWTEGKGSDDNKINYCLPEEMNLGVDEDGFTSKPVEMYAQAYSTDGGLISYRWSKRTLDNEEVEMTVSPKMINTQDAKPVPGKVYYLAKIDDGLGRVAGYTMVGSVDAFEEGKEYFERVTSGTIDTVGKYQVEAQNRVGNANATEISPNLEKEDGKIVQYCTVPAAEAPIIKELPKSLILEYSSEKENKYIGSIADESETPDTKGNKLTYQWFYSKDDVEEYVPVEGANSDVLVILGESDYMKAPTYVDEEGNVKTWEEVEETEAIENDPEFVNLKSKGNGEPGVLLLENEDGEEVETDVVFFPKLDEEKDVIYGDGYYKVRVTNNRNNTTYSLTTTPCRVTHSAIKPDVVPVNGLEDKNERIVVTDVVALNRETGGLKISASIPEFAGENNRTAEDSITYQWFRYSNNKSGDAYAEQLAKDTEKAAKGRYVLSGDFRVVNDTATTPTLVLSENDLDKGRIYFCRVLNTYNGTTAMRCSHFFDVQSAQNN